uniref:Large ribosomal subunit protein mL42 n=2 Tax=Meloidogyne TaxID=189290 RepID=A0A915LV62_MELJA
MTGFLESIGVQILEGILAGLLEKTLLGKEQRLPDDLFSTLNDGILAAPISSIFSQLQLIFPKLPISKFEQLSPLALKSVSKITRIFRITDKLPTKNEQKEEEFLNEQLWLLINPKQRSQHEERTVYVDNLPLNCTHSLLERRCKQFGSVVNILLPQTKRIQRRIFQSSNVNSIQHSGFAFVQFASRTAAKRFCKRYQLNSRLKRTHHSHGHRHKKSKLFLNKQNLCNSEIGDELMKDCSDEKIGENKKEEIQPILTQPDERATNLTSFIVPQVPSLTEISRTRMRSQSVAESIMSVDESGKETDLEEKQNENILQKGIKKHRRRRKPRKTPTTNNKTSNHIFSLTSLFRHIQMSNPASKLWQTVVCKNGVVAAWHPSIPFPYGHSRPVDLTQIEEQKKKFLQNIQKYKDSTEPIKEKGPSDLELREIFYTNMQEWRPRYRETRLYKAAGPRELKSVPSSKMGLLSSPIFNKIGNSKNEENKEIEFKENNKFIE